MVLGSAQLLTEMSARNISWGGVGYMWPVCRVEKTCHLHVSIFVKSGILNVLEPSGSIQACTGVASHLP